MTWGTWTKALIGINHFMHAYEGCNFRFQVLEISEDGTVRDYVGHGSLF